MTSIPMTDMPQDRVETRLPAAPTHLAVQILALLLFGGFAIVATVLAFVAFWPAGVAVTIVLAWIGFGPLLNQRRTRREGERAVAVVHAPPVRSGNASFDAYRDEMLKRLEEEQQTFVGFLDRLREAKDKAEFDTFMDDRARLAKSTLAGEQTSAH